MGNLTKIKYTFISVSVEYSFRRLMDLGRYIQMSLCFNIAIAFFFFFTAKGHFKECGFKKLKPKLKIPSYINRSLLTTLRNVPMPK